MISQSATRLLHSCEMRMIHCSLHQVSLLIGINFDTDSMFLLQMTGKKVEEENPLATMWREELCIDYILFTTTYPGSYWKAAVDA